MQRGHKLTHPAALDMPEGFDPCGVPCADVDQPRTRPASHRRHPRPLPGLPARSLIASVESVETAGEHDWLLWGCAGGRPILFMVGAERAAEMMESVAAGQMTTAIVEPSQLVLERLD